MGTFRIAVLASGTGTNLQAILDGLHGRDGIEVVCVASNKPGARALERAANAGVETGVFPREDHGDRVERDAAMADWLTAREVELIVLAGYMELLSAEFVRRFPNRIVNVHPALLPSFPGPRRSRAGARSRRLGHRGHRSLRRRGRRLRADHPAAFGQRALHSRPLATGEGDSRGRASTASGGDPPDRRRCCPRRRSKSAHRPRGATRGGRQWLTRRRPPPGPRTPRAPRTPSRSGGR